MTELQQKAVTFASEARASQREPFAPAICKTLNFIAFLNNKRMALFLLSTMLMYNLSLSACLISPIDPPIAQQAHNHAPQIVVSSLQPQISASTAGMIDATCEDQQLDTPFELRQVIDYDLDQSLYVSWFVNYDPNPLAINSQPFYSSDAIAPSGEALRDLQQSVKVPLVRLPLNNPNGQQLVEVMVSDARPLSRGDYPNRSLPEGAAFDLFYWIVDVKGCP